MSRINILDESVSLLIAAGEVVERPASVVKELVENSIDSGANKITIEIENGGTTFLRISDNGCGIEKEDVRKAFLRHATSKVKTKEDLDAIFTMGFRGEALASICSVSKMTLITKTKEALTGTKCIMEGSKEVFFDDIGCNDGTTIVVEDLFYNVPARMKFLKKNVTEGNAIANIVDKLALSHPEISFSFIRNSKEVLNTSGNGELKSAVYSVYGKSFAQELMEVDYHFNNVKVKGFTSRPISARLNRRMQIFFVNRRYVKSSVISVALERAYKDLIMSGKFPSAVLFLELPPEMIDINVHPTKTEVKFINESDIFHCIYYAVKSALGKDDKKEEIKLVSREDTKSSIQVENEISTDSKVDEEDYSKGVGNYVEIKTNTNSSENSEINYTDEPELSLPNKGIFHEKEIQNNGVPILRDIGFDMSFLLNQRQKDIAEDNEEKSIETPLQEIFEDNQENLGKFIGELFSTYILIEKNDKLLIIDKHAAHERILYEKLKRRDEAQYIQSLLEPLKVTFDKEEYEKVLSNVEVLRQVGFEVDDFGSGVILVRTLPMIFDTADVQEVFLSTVEALQTPDKKHHSDYLDKIYHTMACKAAIKANDVNLREDLIKLAVKAQTDENIKYCPHGRPITIVLSKKEIEKKFRRI